MSNTGKTASIVAGLVAGNEIRYIVGSPGSRNAPLLDAFNRDGRYKISMIVDERSAAFSALGVAETLGRPVALCCTSGSALMNYTPALAEAYYKNIPMLVITADRQATRIDQGEPQTMRQTGALAAVTAATFEIDHNAAEKEVRRITNQAILKMIAEKRPVHLNIHLAEPLTLATEDDLRRSQETISVESSIASLSTSQMRSLGKEVASQSKVIIYIGQMQPDNVLRKAISRLSLFPNIAILAEPISNLNLRDGIVYGVDAVMSTSAFKDNAAEFLPDYLITIGGSPTGRRFREFIENHSNKIYHIHVSGRNDIQDFYGALNKWVVSDEALFMRQLASALQIYRIKSEYSNRWESLQIPISKRPEAIAVGKILKYTPTNYNIQLSNGLTIRMANRFIPRHHRYSANRGINGIDGSTSTAIGASAVYNGSTLLITGDTSAIYDLSAWGNPLLTSRIKVIILDNCGGGIFRAILPSRDMESREELVCCPQHRIDISMVAQGCGWQTHVTELDEKIDETLSRFFKTPTDSPSLLIIKLPR